MSLEIGYADNISKISIKKLLWDGIIQKVKINLSVYTIWKKKDKKGTRSSFFCVDTFFIDGEGFISYCSDSDFDYAIYIGQKCKVLRNGKCFIGTLYDVDSNKNTFSIKQNNGEIIEINCADVEEIFSEEEIGTIN